MVNRGISILIMISMLASGYIGVRALTRNPCSVTKTWSLGPVDPRFNLSKEDIVTYANEAAGVWNKAYDVNPLFAYKESGGDITITFVYDERQRTTVRNEHLKDSIAEEKGELTELKQTIESLRREHRDLEEDIRTRSTAYNAQLTRHNKEVSSWNQKGGAPAETYKRLQSTAASLETERTAINQLVARYNTLADQIRSYGTEHNEIVGTINEKISTINETALKDFEEGVYDPNTETITIYEYGSIPTLKRVLIHEFGHALSLPHVEDKEAIMYPVNQSTSLELASADREELAYTCREKTLDDVLAFARVIRDDIARLAGWSSYDTAVQAE